MREWLEYAPVWLVVHAFGLLPRRVARGIGIGIGLLALTLHGRLWAVGLHNLELAFPEKSNPERRRILRGVFRTLGRQLADFCLLPRLRRENVAQVAVHDCLENYLAARDRGKGVLFLTAHLGGWEIGSFAHSVYGYPLRIVIRPLDNRRVNALIDRYRTRAGNATFGKQDFARGLLASMRAGETVGILADTNM